MLEAYLVTLLGVVAAQSAPGPNLFAVASAAMGQGRAQGVYLTLGVSTGMCIWAMGIALGLGALFTAYPVTLIILKFIGGAYLLWLGAKAIKSFFTNSPSSIKGDIKTLTYRQNWQRGVFVVLTNPKAALMWSAVGTVLFGAQLATWQVVLFGPLAAVTGFVIYGGYAVLFSSGPANALYKRFARWIEACLGVTFGALGGKLVFDGVRDFSNQ